MKLVLIIVGIILIGAWLIIESLPFIVATVGGACLLAAFLEHMIEF